jgi:ribulose-5-phosphate 4-epimerase/fuculose-1-phosphate aldolase
MMGFMSRPFHATKFTTEFIGREIPDDPRIEELRFWCSEFHRFNLAPLHKYGACGNLSFRAEAGDLSFIITASGTAFHEKPASDNFVRVRTVDLEQGIVYAEGEKRPSSESMLHFAAYRAREDVQAVFHGHSPEILARASEMNLVVTEREDPYGSLELVQSVLEVLKDNFFIVIRKHGFIALGETMESAGERALHIYRKCL